MMNELIRRIAIENDQKAFNEFFNFYNSRLLTAATCFINSEMLAEEIVADVFINIWRKRKSLLTVRKIENFLFTSVKNRAYDFRIKLQNEKVLPLDIESDFVIDGDTPESRYISNEFESLVQNSISNMPPQRQLVFRMVKEDGMTYREVAKKLDISNKTVEYHIGAAISYMKKDVDKYLSYREIDEFSLKSRKVEKYSA